ncbi:MAG TPA: PD-(D/E)XK nuclease family protein, partial [Flavobacterium sp.]|nr:PD-(D/E)XK nuclease family protein [Flavobacterium sp.]
MNQTQFLKKLTIELMGLYPNELSNIIIVLPSKRAQIFLIEHIQSQLSKPIFTPNIISIEDFIEDISGLHSIDSIEVLFEFYSVYSSVTDKSVIQDFETFSKWAKILIQDFNEIDRYLLDPKYIFDYLKEVEALKRWDLEINQLTKLIDATLEFWNKLPLYYNSLYQHLLNKKIGYQGLLYREAIQNLKKYIDQISGLKKIVFAGFNALNKAEEQIFQQLLLHEKALIYWDIDYKILQDTYHDAGYFIRKYKNDWKHYAHQPFQWIENHFEIDKNIQIIGTPKTVGQTKIVGNLIEEIQKTNPNLESTAVVLGDENLLLPVLFNLPQAVESLNVTMGYPSKNNPAQLLVSKLFKLHINAKQRNENQYTYYYKEVLDILNHALVAPYLNAKSVDRIIKKNNFSFFSVDKLFQIHNQQNTSEANELFD